MNEGVENGKYILKRTNGNIQGPDYRMLAADLDVNSLRWNRV